MSHDDNYADLPADAQEDLLDALASMWRTVDPVPEGLSARMRMVARAEDVITQADLDYELLILVERSRELAGARGTSPTYTLRFATEEVDLLLRPAKLSTEGAGLTRLDGWVIPPSASTVRATQVGGEEASHETTVDEHGRFEFPAIPSGLYRLWLMPVDADTKPFATPAFEI